MTLFRTSFACITCVRWTSLRHWMIHWKGIPSGLRGFWEISTMSNRQYCFPLLGETGAFAQWMGRRWDGGSFWSQYLESFRDYSVYSPSFGTIRNKKITRLDQRKHWKNLTYLTFLDKSYIFLWWVSESVNPDEKIAVLLTSFSSENGFLLPRKLIGSWFVSYIQFNATRPSSWFALPCFALASLYWSPSPLLPRPVRTLLSTHFTRKLWPAGAHQLNLDFNDRPSGLYILKADDDRTHQDVKLMHLK